MPATPVPCLLPTPSRAVRIQQILQSIDFGLVFGPFAFTQRIANCGAGRFQRSQTFPANRFRLRLGLIAHPETRVLGRRQGATARPLATRAPREEFAIRARCRAESVPGHPWPGHRRFVASAAKDRDYALQVIADLLTTRRFREMAAR